MIQVQDIDSYIFPKKHSDLKLLHYDESFPPINMDLPFFSIIGFKNLDVKEGISLNTSYSYWASSKAPVIQS